MRSNYFEEIKKYQAEYHEDLERLTKEKLKQYQNEREEQIYGDLYNDTCICRSISNMYV